MSRHSPAQTLAKIPMFKSLSPDAVKALDGRCTWRRVKAKEWVIDYQDEGIDVFFVVGGAVRVLIYARSGREVILADLHAGGYFGELAAIDGKPRSAGVLAVSDALVAAMPGRVFMEVLNAHPDVAMHVLTMLAARVRALDNRVLEYSTLNVRQRIYSELLRLACPIPGDPNQAVMAPPPTHAEIAARVSTHREAVTRELKLLERQGYLKRRRGEVTLTDVPKLMQQLDKED
jgi:CRP/FNR family cyclic AMP-dependent transcriptional regulator